MLFFFKQKTAYEITASDWRSDVCSSDLAPVGPSSCEIEVIAKAGGGAVESCTRLEASDTRGARPPLDPNVVIAAAFKAAGLPPPEDTSQPPGSLDVAPGPIIEAALKAAGLMRR